MPELPEVETVRRGIAPSVEGRTIVVAAIDDPRLTRPEPPDAVAAALAGDTIERTGRRGKYLLLHLASGWTLVVHLRMTGNLLVGPNAVSSPHLRARLALDDGVVVSYTDPRRFGTWALVDTDDLDAYLALRLGPEPLDEAFDWRTLQAVTRGRSAPIKAVLLDQRRIAGVGNIYADEALHRARVHPEQPAGELTAPALKRLAEAIVTVLETGIEAQGATLRDFRTPDGGYGSATERFQVFDRDGEPCPRCGRTIVKTRVAGRGTHHCPRCQPRRR